MTSDRDATLRDLPELPRVRSARHHWLDWGGSARQAALVALWATARPGEAFPVGQAACAVCRPLAFWLSTVGDPAEPNPAEGLAQLADLAAALARDDDRAREAALAAIRRRQDAETVLRSHRALHVLLARELAGRPRPPPPSGPRPRSAPRPRTTPCWRSPPSRPSWRRRGTRRRGTGCCGSRPPAAGAPRAARRSSCSTATASGPSSSRRSVTTRWDNPPRWAPPRDACACTSWVGGCCSWPACPPGTPATGRGGRSGSCARRGWRRRRRTPRTASWRAPCWERAFQWPPDPPDAV
jgi:hypothetical protein